MAKIPVFPTIQEFFFNTPLYAPHDIAANWGEARDVYRGKFRADGHCPYCHQHATFRRIDGDSFVADADIVVTQVSSKGFHTIRIECARDAGHEVRFHLLTERGQIQKVGQFPSLADIANDESKEYRKVLTEEDSQELHKAIGLAAHGVGIGSYVYLRRIFERLIDGRFKGFKDAEGWTEEDYRDKRMPERIELLRDHLPEFLVENKKVYSILSSGIHELAEAEALAFFPVLKASIIMMLEEDEEKRKKLKQKEELKSAIQMFGPSTDKGGGVGNG